MLPRPQNYFCHKEVLDVKRISFLIKDKLMFCFGEIEF